MSFLFPVLKSLAQNLLHNNTERDKSWMNLLITGMTLAVADADAAAASCPPSSATARPDVSRPTSATLSLQKLASPTAAAAAAAATPVASSLSSSSSSWQDVEASSVFLSPMSSSSSSSSSIEHLERKTVKHTSLHSLPVATHVPRKFLTPLDALREVDWCRKQESELRKFTDWIANGSLPEQMEKEMTKEMERIRSLKRLIENAIKAQATPTDTPNYPFGCKAVIKRFERERLFPTENFLKELLSVQNCRFHTLSHLMQVTASKAATPSPPRSITKKRKAGNEPEEVLPKKPLYDANAGLETVAAAAAAAAASSTPLYTSSRRRT